MRSKLIVLLILFCGCFNSAAQKEKTNSRIREESTKYFDAKVYETASTLYPKDMILPRADPPFRNDYVPKNLDKFFIESFNRYKKEFGKPTPEEEEALSKTAIELIFDSSFNVIYFQIYYPSAAWDQLPKLERKLHRLGHSFKSLNLRPYIDAYYKDELKIVPFEWQLKFFIQYDKSRAMEYKGDYRLRILPAKE